MEFVNSDIIKLLAEKFRVAIKCAKEHDEKDSLHFFSAFHQAVVEMLLIY